VERDRLLVGKRENVYAPYLSSIFHNGSTWGDDAAVQNVMLQRKETLEYMNLLKAAYMRGGSNALDASLHQLQYINVEPCRR